MERIKRVQRKKKTGGQTWRLLLIAAPGIVAWERELEYRSAISPAWRGRLRDRDIVLLRYRDARPPEHEISRTGTNF